MKRVAWLIAFACALAGAETNFVQNSDIAEADNGEPDHWRLFVMPMDGAYGGVDNEVAHAGERSLTLYNPRRYEEEPANNWSQNILEDLAGETLHLSGYIRTEDATEAAIWVQCIRNRPWGVLRTISTSDRRMVRGTRDWTNVEATFEVPSDTDFIVVRCVLKGEGRAWFDNIQLRPAAADEEPPEEEDAGEPEPQRQVRTAPGIPPPRDETTVETGMDQAMLNALLEANQALLETYRELRSANELLYERLSDLEGELRGLREELAEVEAEIAARMEAAGTHENEEAAPSDEERREYGPVLVPRNQNGQ